jgi:hypothetical protein
LTPPLEPPTLAPALALSRDLLICASNVDLSRLVNLFDRLAISSKLEKPIGSLPQS